MKVVWTPEAEQDRLDIRDVIASDKPSAAVRMDDLFSEAAYEVDQDTVWILALVRTERQWPPLR